MAEPVSTASAFVTLLKTVIEAIKGLDPKTVVVMMVVFAIAAGGYLTADHKLFTSSHWTSLGGLDLDDYCASYHYKTTTVDACSSPVDLNIACSWTWSTPMRAVVNGTYSTRCYTNSKPPVYKGGISDMDGYCRSAFQHSAGVRAVPSGSKSWVCRTDIDKGVACAWQYQKQGLEARKDNELWHCYARDDS